MSKTILFLTDFSKPSDRAGEFAVNFANQYHAEKFVVLHSYRTITEEIEVEKKQTLANISENFGRLLSGPTHVQTVLESGKIEDVVEDYLKKNIVDYIVLGITGNNKLQQRILGDSATAIIQMTYVPTFLVPYEASVSSELKSIVLATDYHHVNKATFPKAFLDYLQSTGIQINVLNVTEELNESENQLETVLGNSGVTYNDVVSSNVPEAVKNFAIETNADLLVLLGHHYHFLERIFHKSLTKELSYITDVPLLVIPEKA